MFCTCAFSLCPSLPLVPYIKNVQVIPAAGWDWARFLDIAAGLLPYAFEKEDAQVCF